MHVKTHLTALNKENNKDLLSLNLYVFNFNKVFKIFFNAQSRVHYIKVFENGKNSILKKIMIFWCPIVCTLSTLNDAMLAPFMSPLFMSVLLDFLHQNRLNCVFSCNIYTENFT